MATKTKAAEIIRVGDEYYKIIPFPLRNNEQTVLEHQLVRYSKEMLIEDDGPEVLKTARVCKAFCNIPDNLNFQRFVMDCVNVAQPIIIPPAERLKEGDCAETMKFLQHVFGDQQDVALDYFKLVYEKPTQMLPAIFLKGRRATGKTVFLKWVHQLFLGASCMLDRNAFNSAFNSYYAARQVILIDDLSLEPWFCEKVLYLASSDKIMRKGKGDFATEMDFFGKLIVSVQYEPLADRSSSAVWIVEMKPLTSEQWDTLLVPKLSKEIPSFLAFLRARTLSTGKKTRHWFYPQSTH